MPELAEQCLGRTILWPGFGTNDRKLQLLESGVDSRTRSFEAHPLTPEMPVPPAADTDHGPGAVVLVLQADIANDLPGFGVNHGPETQLIIALKEIDLGLHPFSGLIDSGG